MRHSHPTRAAESFALAVAITLAGELASTGTALAAGPAHQVALANAPIASIGSLLGSIAGSVLGGVSWTVNLAGSFILNLVGGLVKDLIPRSWIHQGLQIMQWLVAVPDYTGKIASPTGAQVYGFPGVNAMRGLYTWLGVAILPLTLVYATVRAWTGQGDHVALPVIRAVTVSVGVISYTWLWGQGVAVANLTTTAILGVPAVTAGITKMFTLLVAGAALGGLDLIGELLMAAAAAGLIGMIFLKVVLVLIGALVYAIGPLMIGLAPTERGHAIARTWASLATALFAIGVLWAGVFAVSAVLIGDAGSGGALIGGGTSVGKLLSGVVIAMAAIAGFYVNIKLTKAVAAVLGGQLAGMLAHVGSRGGVPGLIGGAGGTSRPASAAVGGAGASLRGFAGKVAGGAGGALGAVAPSGRAGTVLAGAATGAGALARGGLVGAGGAIAARGISGAASSNLGRAAAATRAGAIATRVARGGQDGWQRVAGRAGENHAAAAGAPRTEGSPEAPVATATGAARADAPGGRLKRKPNVHPAPPTGPSTVAQRGPGRVVPNETARTGSDASLSTPARSPIDNGSAAPAGPRRASTPPLSPPSAAPPDRGKHTVPDTAGGPATPARTPPSPASSRPAPAASPFAQRTPEKPGRSFKPRRRKGPKR